MDALYTIQSTATVIIALCLYVYLVASVYPWLTMRLAMRKQWAATDRGIRRVKFPEGRGVIYRPDLKVQRYVPAYALLTTEGKKYIRLQVHPLVNYIRYDVATFDAKGKLLDVQKVAERLTTRGATRAVRLPTATACATVIPRRVDGEYLSREYAVGYSTAGTLICSALTLLTTLAVAYLIHGELTSLLEGMTVSLGKALLLSLPVGALTAGWIALMHRRHATRKINR